MATVLLDGDAPAVLRLAAVNGELVADVFGELTTYTALRKQRVDQGIPSHDGSRIYTALAPDPGTSKLIVFCDGGGVHKTSMGEDGQLRVDATFQIGERLQVRRSSGALCGVGWG